VILPLTPVRLKRYAAQVFGNKIGVVCEDHRFTYREFSQRCDRLSDALLQMGLKTGGRVAYLSFNCHRLLEAYYGVPQIGAILLPLNIRLSPEELGYILNDASPSFLFFDPEFLPLVEALRSNVPSVERYIALRGARPAWADERLYDELVAGSEPHEIDYRRIDENSVAELFYTSGTTAHPKGVMLTHRNLVANLCQCHGMRNWEGFGEQDTIMAVLPFFHIYGMVVIMMLGLCNGGTILVMPRFEMQEFLAAVTKYRVSVLPLVPPIVLGLVKHPLAAHADLSSVRLVFSGAAPLGEDIARELSRKLNCPVTQGYGMTEASPVTHLSPTTNVPLKPGSAGCVVPSTEVKIIDVVTGAPVVQGQEGELLIRGPQIMKGYLNQPGETAACLDREGWYHTGDVGYVDADGYFFIVDRTKELIKYKGLQVAPAELEALLVTHPAVLDAAVVRKADEEAGEVPKAFIVLKADEASKSTRAEAIMGWVAERVAPHKRIRHLEFIEQIPKSASGKILRRVLMDRDKPR